MSDIRRKIKEEENRVKQEAKDKEARLADLVRTDPGRARAAELIPKVRQHMKEFAGTLGLYLEETKGSKINGREIKVYGYDSPIAKFVIWQDKVPDGWFSSRYIREVFVVWVGRTFGYQNGIKTDVIAVNRAYSNDVITGYDFEQVPKGSNFDNWFTDILLYHYKSLPSKFD